MTSTALENPMPNTLEGYSETGHTDCAAYGRERVRRVRSRVDIGHEANENGTVKGMGRW